jgi:hypothetical protein
MSSTLSPRWITFVELISDDSNEKAALELLMEEELQKINTHNQMSNSKQNTNGVSLKLDPTGDKIRGSVMSKFEIEQKQKGNQKRKEKKNDTIATKGETKEDAKSGVWRSSARFLSRIFKPKTEGIQTNQHSKGKNGYKQNENLILKDKAVRKVVIEQFLDENGVFLKNKTPSEDKHFFEDLNYGDMALKFPYNEMKITSEFDGKEMNLDECFNMFLKTVNVSSNEPNLTQSFN